METQDAGRTIGWNDRPHDRCLSY